MRSAAIYVKSLLNSALWYQMVSRNIDAIAARAVTLRIAKLIFLLFIFYSILQISERLSIFGTASFEILLDR
jgi:hypothetical protein